MNQQRTNDCPFRIQLYSFRTLCSVLTSVLLSCSLLLPVHTISARETIFPRPYLVSDIAAGTDGSLLPPPSVTSFVYMGDTLYFIANDRIHGTELWKSDGTGIGTEPITDLRGTNGGINSPLALSGTGSMLFFGATDDDSGAGFWKSDGTASGTMLLKTYEFGNILQMNEMEQSDNGIYFSFYDGVTPVELWKSDGTALGTTKIFSNTYPEQLTFVNDTLYYVELAGNPRSLWKTDGTGTGTMQLKSFERPIPNDVAYDVDLMVELGGKLYFSAYDDEHGRELWQTDGSESGTTLVKDIHDGTASSYISRMLNLNGTLYFGATDSVHGSALWKSDGTPEGTVLVKDFNPGSGLQDVFYGPQHFVPVGGNFYFMADDGTHGIELWKSDGTADGTNLVKDLNPGATDTFGGTKRPFLTEMDGYLYFAADDGTTGVELWRTDGTAEGTQQVADLWPGTTGSTPMFLTNGNGTLYFAADDGIHGIELWAFDPNLTETLYIPIIRH